MRIIFPSLASPSEYGYSLEGEHMQFWDQLYRGGRLRFVHEQAGYYRTYGDGFVQHSPASAVPIDRLADYCLSLSKYLLERPQHQEFAASVLHWVFQDYQLQKWPAKIKFLMGLRHDEKKWHRYFSIHHDDKCFLKVSAAEGKRHDNRWTEIPTDADGSAEFVWRQLIGDESGATRDGLTAYHARESFQEIYREADGYNCESPGEYLKIDRESMAAGEEPKGWIPAGPAVYVLRNIIQGVQQLKYAKDRLESALSNANLSPQEIKEEAVA